MSEYLIRDKAKAWGVHAFTISGVILGLLATLALLNGQPKACLLWLGAALLVDGLDGTLARRFEVKLVLPNFDGAVLDLVIDYLTYVFVPVLFIYEYVPMPGSSELLAVAVILVSSLFCFCNVNMKSQDNYFVGFPAAWNLVAMYLYLIALEPISNLVIVVLLAALTLTQVKFLHPFRVRRFMAVNIASTCIWLFCSAWLIWQFPQQRLSIVILWWLSGIYFVAICAWRTLQEWRS